MFDARARQRKPGGVGPVLIVKTGEALPGLRERRGDYEDWLAEGLAGVLGIEVRDVRSGAALPEPTAPRAVLVTGSSALVTDREPWSEGTGRWLAAVARHGTPMLAVCYGHQLLAQALGGEVGDNGGGREIGVVEVHLTEEASEDPLFEGMPSPLRVSSSHQQSVLSLPDRTRRLASNAASANQAYRFGERAWGVQFHPEWDHEVIRAYLEARAKTLRGEGLDPQALLDAITPSDHGRAILERFGSMI